MKNNIEVELRGPLTEGDYNRLNNFFNQKAEKRETKRRILIDYTTCIEGEDIRNRSTDIRARITNEIPEIIIKIGKWKGSDARKEISVLLQKGQFSNLVQAYAALGYKKGVLCVRNSVIYIYKNIEFALVEVPGHSYFFEAEVIASSEVEIKTAQNKIEGVCKELELKLFSDADWFNYIESLNKEANKLFDIEKDGEDYFIKKYSV